MRAWIPGGVLLACIWGCAVNSSNAPVKWALAIHGGAGVIERVSMTRENEAAYRAALSSALETGAKVLSDGGSTLDTVESTIRLMEDDPLFNTGRSAVFTATGRNELNASIINGSNLSAKAVTGITRARHPITVARTVIKKSPHVMLANEGADSFAKDQGLKLVDPSFFFTERRWQKLEETLRKRGEPIPARPTGAPKP